MGIRSRIFIIIFISMGLGVLFSYIISSNSNISLLLIVLFLFIAATAASAIFANFTYKNISELESATSKIAGGKTKTKYLEALPVDSIEFGGVARSISQISENLKNKINLIAKQRDQFGSVLDDLGEGIIVADIDGNITYENEKFSLLKIEY